MSIVKRVENALKNTKFTRGARLDAETVYAVSLSWPAINLETGQIRLKTFIRTFGKDGIHSEAYSGLLADENKGADFTFWDLVRNTGLRTHNNSVIVRYNTAAANAPSPELEIMVMPCKSENERSMLAHTLTSGYC